MHLVKALNSAFANMKANTTSKYKTQLLQFCALALISGTAALAGDTDPITKPVQTGPLGTGRPRTIGETTPILTGPTVPGEVSREGNTEIRLPDLVPLSIEAWKGPQDEEIKLEHWDNIPVWHYKTIISVGNFGKADADWFCGTIEFKVLETTDPLNWPVGAVNGWGTPSFMQGAQVLDVVYAKYCYVEGFYIPKCVKKAEVRFIVDKYYKYLGGTPEYGRIVESNEDNNFGDPIIIDTTVQAE